MAEVVTHKALCDRCVRMVDVTPYWYGSEWSLLSHDDPSANEHCDGSYELVAENQVVVNINSDEENDDV